MCSQIKEIADKELKTGDLGEFLKLWAELEELLVTKVGKQSKRFLGVREAIRQLSEEGLINKELAYQIDRLRNFRNSLVHTPKKITSGQVQDYLYSLENILREIKPAGNTRFS